MATYQSVQRQIADLQKKAEVLRKAEAAKVIAGIKAQIAKYSLIPSDLFEGGVADIAPATVSTQKSKAPPAAKAIAKKSDRLAPKYIDPVTKKTWSGWGKAPAWIKSGKREDFLIGKEQSPVARKAKPVEKKSTAKAAAQAPAKPVVKTVAAVPSKKLAAAKIAVPAPKAASKPVTKASAAVKTKSAPVAKPAAVAKTKPASAVKPVAVVKAKAVTTPAPKAAPVKPKAALAKKTPSAKRPAVSPQKPAPEDKGSGVEAPVTGPAPVAATPAAETGIAE